MRVLVRKLDRAICAKNRVFEFSQDTDCLLRMQVSQAHHHLQLPDLTIQAGEPVLLLHLWNERLPRTPAGGSDLTWASQLLRPFKRSLHMAANILETDPRLQDIRAVGGATILLTVGMHASGARIAQALGFSVFAYQSRLGRFGEFWENFYSWLLIWTYNPASLPRHGLTELHRWETWMSRGAIIRQYA